MTAAAAGPRVLYVTHRVPYPPDKGDRIRNFHVLRALARRAEIWLVALADEPVPPETLAALREHCVRVAVVPVAGKRRWFRAAVSALRGRSLTEGLFREPAADRVATEFLAEARFDAALVSASGLAPMLRRKPLRDLPAFVDLVDVDSQKWLDFADAAGVSGLMRRVYRFEGHRLRKLERELPGWAAAVAIVSPAEAEVYESFAAAGTATVATNGVDLDYYAPVPADAPTVPACVFVGALDYLPNVDAAVHFARHVWPLVRARVPDAEFHVVGRKPTAEVRALGELPGVVVVGQVPDVRPFVARGAVVVCPMRLSRGLQNKVLEAMAMAKPVVAGPPALAALSAVPGRDLLCAETPAEWADALAGLLNDPARRRELGANARRFVEAHHHWDRCLEPLVNLVAGVGTP
jgi:sugar transferase (PEP-CTERM/EpsH1 system associated)